MFVKSVFKCVDTRCTDDLLRQVVPGIHNAVAEAVQSDVRYIHRRDSLCLVCIRHMMTITNLTELKQWTEFVHTSMSAPWSPSKWQMTRHSYNIVIY